MVAPVLAIPLIATYGPALATATGAGLAALAGLAVGRAVNAARAPAAPAANQVLTPESKPEQFAEAASNYVQAETELQQVDPGAINQGQVANLEAAKEVAAKYDYVAADESSGRLGVLANQQLAAGGDLQVTLENNTVNFSNDVVDVNVPFENYGTAESPLAVSGDIPIEVTLPEDAAYPFIANQDVITGDVQRVAQTAIETQKINDAAVADLATNSTEYPVPINDAVTSESSDGINFVAADPPLLGGLTVTTPADAIPLDTPDPRKATGYVEDARGPVATAGVVSGTASSTQVEQQNRTNTLAASEAAAASANPNAPGSVDMPPPVSNTPSNNAAASNPNYTPQEIPTLNTSVNGVSRQIPQTQEQSNPLHDYANYTYKFSIYAVPRQTINKIANGEISPGNEQGILASGELLISSGGIAKDSRSPMFGVDFIIDNVNLTSVVGLSSRSRATDVIEFNFDIIEPYNTTLLPRLIGTSYRLTGKPDFASCFFVMKIDFLGYDDLGNPVMIPKTSKFLPFSMVNMDFEVGNRGTVYKIKGIPVNHAAQTILDNTIPFHMEISGGTVNEIFNGDVAQVTAAPAANQRSEAAPSSTVSLGPKTFSKGVKQALDEGEEFLKKNRALTQPNVYNFDFRDGIGDSKIIDPQVYRTQGFRMSDPKKPDELNPDTTKLDPSKNTLRLQAGTKITDLINTVLQVSTYYTGQYSTDRRPNRPLNMHKIVPTIKFGEMDPLTNLYQREITYVVTPYTVFGNDKENFGQMAPKNPVKKYQWIFTGQNKDIIDFKLSYKMSFFELRNGADKSLVSEAEGATANPNDGGEASGSSDAFGFLDTGVFPRRVRPVFGLADQSNSGAKDRSIKTLKLEELFKKQFDPVGDLVSLDLRVVGDPDLIQQDNLLYGASSGTTPRYASGGINFKDFEVYFLMEFKNPSTDYDSASGLFNLSSNETNYFSGLYRIVQVKSEFRQGKFTQTLKNYRVRRQSDAQPNTETRPGNSSQPRAETPSSTAVVNAPQGTAADANRSTVPATVNETDQIIRNTPLSGPAELAVGTPFG